MSLQKKIGIESIPAGDTSDVVITGLGFIPTGITIRVTSQEIPPSGTHLPPGTGYTDGTDQAYTLDYNAASCVSNDLCGTGNLYNAEDGNGDAFAFNLKSIDADGFTLEVEDNDVAQNVVLVWEAFRSDEVTTAAIATAVAAAILDDPSNLLYTDSNGNVRATTYKPFC